MISISELAISEFVEDLSTPNLFRELLQDPEVNLTYLVEMLPYDETVQNSLSGIPPISAGSIGEFDFTSFGGLNTVYISNTGYTTEPNESPSNRVYLPLTDNPYQYEVSILNGDEFRGGIPSFGAVRLLNGDAELDSLINYYWNGREIKVYAGSEDFQRSQFALIFDGVCSGAEWSEDQIIINIQNKSQILETEFLQNLYGGEGGLDGNSDIEGNPKPLIYGECKNVTPVLVDPANLIYQIHDGSISSVDNVYDRGVELTNAGDVADITATSVSSGEFKTQLSGGYIKLGSSPDGTITINAKGDNSGGYVSKPAEIVQRIVTTKLGSKSFSQGTIDGGAFNVFDETVNYDIGIYIPETTTGRNVLDQIIIPLQGYWTFTRQGLLTLGVIDSPSNGDLIINDRDIIEISMQEKTPPSYRLTVGYARSWTKQTADNLAGAATTAYETFVSQEYRKSVSLNPSSRAKTSSTIEREFKTSIINESDSLDLLSRAKRIYGEKRERYRLKINGLLFQAFVGSSVTLKIPRFSLDNGKDFIITSISESAENNQTTLEVWG
jgi:hypothetical protein